MRRIEELRFDSPIVGCWSLFLLPPPPELAPFVEVFWAVHGFAHFARERILPKTTIEAATRSSESIVNSVLWKARFWVQNSQRELNERQLKALNRMLDPGPGGFVGGMTNKKYASLTKASPATAQRDLGDLVEKGCHVLVGSGRGARYELAAMEGG